MRHPAFRVPATIGNGFDVVEADGVVYLRVIIVGRATHAVPQTPAELRALAANLQKAADLADAR